MHGVPCLGRDQRRNLGLGAGVIKHDAEVAAVRHRVSPRKSSGMAERFNALGAWTTLPGLVATKSGHP